MSGKKGKTAARVTNGPQGLQHHWLAVGKEQLEGAANSKEARDPEGPLANNN